MPKIVLLWTDIVIYLMLAGLAWYVWHVRNSPNLRATWFKVVQDPAAMAASVVLTVFVVIALLDSAHFRRALPPAPGIAQTAVAYSTRTESLLDALLARQIAMREKSYSVPLAYTGFLKESEQIGGETVRTHPRLQFGGAHLADPQRQWASDVSARAFLGLIGGVLVAGLISLLMVAAAAKAQARDLRSVWQDIAARKTTVPWRAVIVTILVLSLLIGPAVALMNHYHVLGTDRTGNDILYQALKSIRTAFVIGSLTTIATLPFAVLFGVAAGYFRGWVDDVIQYIYTTLSSVPNVLLIAACVLMIQVFIDKNAQLFETGLERADLRLFFLCLILGLTGWADLCRLLRAETLKLREMDFVQAAQAFGAKPWQIVARHILPNVMHLVLITTVLSFSALVLYEAVLSYVGVGVDPSMQSFGGMINLARSEMSRDPVVWWAFASAFVFMVTMVLAANLVADAVQVAFDPRARKFRAKLVPVPAAAAKP
jgi:peptide/nickel transport system permease protein